MLMRRHRKAAAQTPPSSEQTDNVQYKRSEILRMSKNDLLSLAQQANLHVGEGATTKELREDLLKRFGL